MKQTQSPGTQLLMLVALSVCCALIAQVLARLGLMLYFGEDFTPEERGRPFVVLYELSILHVFLHIVVFFAFLRVSSLSWRDIFPVAKARVYILLLLPLVAFAAIILLELCMSGSLSFFERIGGVEILKAEMDRQILMEPLIHHENFGQFIFCLFALALLPAIGEEFIYRGLLLTRIVAATGTVHFSVLVSALIFSAIHMQPANLLGITLMGVGLGYLFYFTRNIWYNVLLHFFINAIQIGFAFYLPDFSFSL